MRGLKKGFRNENCHRSCDGRRHSFSWHSTDCASTGADANSLTTNDDAKVTYAPTAGGFGDQAASHAWEMSPVTGELEGKLDSKTARVGDRVVLKTTGEGADI